MTTPNFTLLLADGRSVIARVADDGNASLTIEGVAPVYFRRQDAHVQLESLPEAFPVSGLLALLGQVFCNSSRVPLLEVSAPLSLDRARDAIRQGVFDTLLGHDGHTARLACSRSSFWQHPLPWLATSSAAGMPLRYTLAAKSATRSGHRSPTARSIAANCPASIPPSACVPWTSLRTLSVSTAG